MTDQLIIDGVYAGDINRFRYIFPMKWRIFSKKTCSNCIHFIWNINVTEKYCKLGIRIPYNAECQGCDYNGIR